MSRYAKFGPDGNVLGFYAEDVHGARMRPVYLPDEPVHIGDEPNPDCKIPADAVAISDDQWIELVSYQGLRRWDGSAVVVYTPPAPAATTDDVNAERQRRITAGRLINGVRVTGRDEDARNLMSLALIAQMRIAAADTTTATTYRDGDNVDHTLTPPQIVSMWQESAAYVSALYQASWDIKAMDPIPADFAADQYWP